MTGPPTVRRVGSRWSRDCEGWSCSTNPRSMARHNAHLGEEEIQPRITGGYGLRDHSQSEVCWLMFFSYPQLSLCACGVRTLCARFLYLDVPRAARMRAGGRPSWRRLGPRRDEPQLSFRLSREMASLVVVSGIAGVEVLVKPCVGHAWKADAVSGEDETGARARAREFQRTHAPAATQHTTSTACRQRRSKSGP